MTHYYLGIDVGGSKSHALIADEQGQAVGFGAAGAGNWEVVGYDGLTRALTAITQQALDMAGITIGQIAAAGMGMGGYDWPCQHADHLNAIAPLGLQCTLEIANDATLGIWAGAAEGWGVSVVAGSGCNARAVSRDHQRQGRMIGGAEHWSGEWVGGYGVVSRAIQAVAWEWSRRGPATALTPAFLKRFSAASLDDLMEGLYLERYNYEPRDALLVFQIANQGDPAALDVVRAVGETLGEMACGVIRQAEMEGDAFEVVLIGSLYKGHALIAETMRRVIHQIAPKAQLVHLSVPPVVGGVIRAMQLGGLHTPPLRQRLLDSTSAFLRQPEE
jgi:N-acetylglucosamine kinase-like BadF-type ATPase